MTTKTDKTQKEFLESKLVELLYLFGTSGKEERIQKYLMKELDSLKTDFVKMDSYGNIHTQFTLGSGDGAVLHLNSHMDTVSGVKEDKKIVNDNGVFTAILPDGKRGILGADDRAGIATILTIINYMPKFDGKLKVSFYREEEIGCVGSTKSDKSFLDDVDLSITFDRRGSSDIVVGSFTQPFACNEVGDWLETLSQANGFKYKPIEGGISDAMTVSEHGINAVNLSVGYYNEHTYNEYLVFSELYTTLEFARCIMRDLNKVKYTFTSVPTENKWIKAWDYKKSSSYGGYYDSSTQRWIDEEEILANQGFYAPVAWVEKDEIAVLSDGAYEMHMNLSELDDLIADLTLARNLIDANLSLSDFAEAEKDLPF